VNAIIKGISVPLTLLKQLRNLRKSNDIWTASVDGYIYITKMSYFAAVTSNINADVLEMGILRVSAFHHDKHLDLNETTKKCAHNQFSRHNMAIMS
jgi:hypothetical protein